MADTHFGQTSGSGYILINTGGGASDAFYVSNEISTQELLTLTSDGRLLLGERSDPDLEIRRQDRTIRFKKSWTLQSGDTSTSSDINVSANDDLQLTYGAQAGAATTLFKFDDMGRAEFFTAIKSHSGLTLDGDIHCNGAIVRELDALPTPSRPGLWALTDTNGTRYFIWASTQGQLRVNPSVPPTIGTQASPGAAIAQLAVVSPWNTNYTASAGEVVLVDPSSGTVDISLPLAGNAKNGTIVVKNASNSDNDVRILPTGGTSIDNSNSVVIRGHSGYATVVCDGTAWWVVSERDTI